jgi:hypothetical protein
MTAPNVTPIRRDVYKAARRAVLDAGDDWPAMLGAAATLAGSPHASDQAFARNVRDRYAAHLRRTVEDVALRHLQEASARGALRRWPVARLLAACVIVAALTSIAFHLLTH